MLDDLPDEAEKLVQVFSAKDHTSYARLLADDPKVFEDGSLVAQNKAEWLERLGPKSRAEGVTFKLAPGYASTGRLLFSEYFNSLASWARKPTLASRIREKDCRPF